MATSKIYFYALCGKIFLNSLVPESCRGSSAPQSKKRAPLILAKIARKVLRESQREAIDRTVESVNRVFSDSTQVSFQPEVT